MKSIKLTSVTYFIFGFMAIFLSTQLEVKATPANHIAHNVLILNSYQRGLSWTDDQTQTIITKLKEAKPHLNISVEYMDWKRYPIPEVQQAFYNTMKIKYANEKIDLIITTDDAALNFAFKYRAELFSAAPIVFSGVNYKGVSAAKPDNSNFTGVLEEIDVEGTIGAALRINPNLKKVYLIADNTESGQSTSEIASNSIEKIKKDLEIVRLNNLSQEEIIERLSKEEKNSIILITTYFMDVNNALIDNEYFTSQLSQSSNIPIYHIYEFSTDDGVVGGSMISGNVLGSQVANLALKILDGKRAFDLPIASPQEFKLFFDYNQLKKHSIALSSLPNHSIILNNPYEVLETYRTLIIGVVTTIIILLIFVLVLIFFLQKTRSMKSELELNHEELTQIYEELSATDDELRSQYSILSDTQEDLVKSEQRYKLILDATNDGIWDWDLLTGEVYFSDKWYDVMGYDKASYIHDGVTFESLVHPQDLEKIKKIRKAYFNRELEEYECEYRIRTKDGSYKWLLSRGEAFFNEEGKPIRMIGSHMDISKLKEYQQDLKKLAYYDQLTGLYNRTYLNEKFSIGVTDTGIEAMIFVDTDNLKFVNDTLGHTYGDKVIIQVSKKLSSITTPNCSLFRLGGDEFILYLKGVENKNAVENYVKNIISSFKTPVFIEDNTINITVSVGVSLFPQDGTTVDNLLKCADMAMYKSKENGKNRYSFFDQTMNEQVTSRVNIENQFKSALENKEFILHYQPQIDIRTNRIYGFEALVRWQNKELGLVPPFKFICIAEETGFIVPLGEWILRTACKFASDLSKDMNSSFKISINISVTQILQDNFCDMVMDTLKSTELTPSMLELEITESIIMESPELVTKKLQYLRDNGISIALDDFGTGYSSLGYLKNLPINTLKIDKLFIDDITNNSSKNIITDSIISLGHNINLAIVSEGVETEEQLVYLKNNRCDIIQGYFFSKPLPPEQLAVFIKEFNIEK